MIIYKGHASFAKAISSAHEFAQSTLGYVQAKPYVQNIPKLKADHMDHSPHTFAHLVEGEALLKHDTASRLAQDPSIISLFYKQHCEVISHYRIVIRKMKKIKKYMMLSKNDVAQAKMRTLENLRSIFETHFLFDRDNIANLSKGVGAYGFFQKLGDRVLVKTYQAKIAIRENRGKASACGISLLALKIGILVFVIRKYSKRRKGSHHASQQDVANLALMNPVSLMYPGYIPMNATSDANTIFG